MEEERRGRDERRGATGPNAGSENGSIISGSGSEKQQQLGCSGPLTPCDHGATAHAAPVMTELGDKEHIMTTNTEAFKKECGVKEQRSSSAPKVGMIITDQKSPLRPTKRRMTSFFVQGKFLQNSEVRKGLEKWKSSGGVAPAMLSKLYRSLRDSSDMLGVCSGLEATRFPVTWLKHVTTVDNFRGILKDGAFYGSNRPFYLKGKVVDLRVCCWSPHIPRPEVERFKNKRFEEFMQRLEDLSNTCEHLCIEELGEVRDVLANSPALSLGSRYGNVQFTQRLEELLWSYKEQHCEGQEPVLRVLGTEAYKLEVVHWVLIHSPFWREFEHLPLLDSVWPRSRRGNLMWAPESTTDLYTWYIDPIHGPPGEVSAENKPKEEVRPLDVEQRGLRRLPALGSHPETGKGPPPRLRGGL